MELPLEDRLRWLLLRTSWLLARGAEPVRGLVQPTPEFFPERPDGSSRAMRALLARTLEHAGLSDVDVAVTVSAPEEEVPLGSCSTPGCAKPGAKEGPTPLIAPSGSGYAVSLPLALAGSPPLLGAHLARVAAALFLHEADALPALDRREAEGAVDLTAIMLGFGVMIANGSHVVSKGCGGVRVARGTALPVEEAGVALALFTRLFSIDAATARRHLEVTPKAAFDGGDSWAEANRSVVRMVRDSPRGIEEGTYRLKPAGGWLTRVLGIGRKAPTDALDADDEALARALAAGRPRAPRVVDAARAARMERARAIVDEALAKD